MKKTTSVSTKKRKPTEKSNDEPSRPPKVVHNKEKQIWIENQSLFEKTITREFEVYYTEDVKSGKSKQNKVLIESVEMIKEYKLEATDKGSLRKLRKSNEPLFIFKDGENYYYTKIRYDMSFLNALDVEHKCAPHNGVCRRMCPAADECGGCAKVRDLYAHPEKYEWIAKAYEVVNTKVEAFIVIECMHHEIEFEHSNSIDAKGKIDNDNCDEMIDFENEGGNTGLYLESNWNWFPEVYY